MKQEPDNSQHEKGDQEVSPASVASDLGAKSNNTKAAQAKSETGSPKVDPVTNKGNPVPSVVSSHPPHPHGRYEYYRPYHGAPPPHPPPHPPPPPHPHPHPHPHPPPGYDHSRTPAAPPGGGTSETQPALGPYTAAQYEVRKPPPPLPPGIFSKVQPPTGQSFAQPPTGQSFPSHQASTTRPATASATSSPSTGGKSLGRDPPPLPLSSPHHYRHPGMLGEHPPPPPPHRHHSYPPYREEQHRGGPAPPPPMHRHGWTNHDYGSGLGARRYYESAPTGSPHSYPPPPPLPAAAAATATAAGGYPRSNSSDAMAPPTTMSTKGGHPQPPVGPYRFSDPTLRREALTSMKIPGGGIVSMPMELAAQVDGREGATSPSQIESSHREEVTTMGCTCKKTMCLKLYCQCFAVKIYCGSNCRCMICHNTAKCEKQRQDAIRNILSRNPQAFDTKFKKGAAPDKVLPELAHKLGCKCRKSACMKKYCECYAGNVKCSSNCRCVGCKNMPRGGPGNEGGACPPVPAVSRNHLGPPPITSSSLLAPAEDPTRKREPYMMNAAQNLAFLKHASPMAKKSSSAPRRTLSQDNGDVGSMPSLASEESPTEATKTEDKVQVSVMPKPNTAEKTAVNALLMAAVAMTEMSGVPTTTTPSKALASTPPESKTRGSGMQDDADQYETPQKNLMRQFQSPKRKKSDAETPVTGRMRPQATGEGESSAESSPSNDADEGADDSPKREHSDTTDFTPSVQHKIKRSRIGSLRKGPRNLGHEMAQDHAKSMVMETPKQAKTGGPKNELTPVSARCIDFKRMHVHESGGTPQAAKMSNSPAAVSKP